MQWLQRGGEGMRWVLTEENGHLLLSFPPKEKSYTPTGLVCLGDDSGLSEAVSGFVNRLFSRSFSN